MIRKFVIFVSIVLCYSITVNNNVLAIKIVATVSDKPITDYDVNFFAKIMCQMHNSHARPSVKGGKELCVPSKLFSDSLMALIDNKLKALYIQKMNIDVKDTPEVIAYTNTLFMENKIDPKQLSDDNLNELKQYIATDYIWNAILANFAHSLKITDSEIDEYIKLKDSSMDRKLSKNEIKQQLTMEKTNKKASEIMMNIRKFYLVEFRI